jgi:hypothetical protein
VLVPSILSLALWATPSQAPDALPVEASASLSVADADALAVNADFIEGRRLYESFEFEKASFRFRAATRAPLGDVDRARALVWLGVAQGQAGDAPAARESFAAALALDPASSLPPDAPPTLEPVFSEARAAPKDAPAPAAPAAPPAAAPSSGGPSLPTVVGAIVAGAGVLIVGGGAGVGVLASSQANEAAAERFQDDAIAGYESAQTTALLANGLLVVGGAAVGTGVAVLVGGALLSE